MCKKTLIFLAVCVISSTLAYAAGQAIDANLRQRMQGKSWQRENAVKLPELAYLTVTYWGFDGQPHQGEMIVHRQVADDVAAIFAELFAARFPIAKIRLIDDYSGSDDRSMGDNNTSAFCTRAVTGQPGKYSKHSYGVAIDINPIQNPYIKNGKILPPAGKDYLNRTDVRKGMIVKNDVCYRAFTKRGWRWGGDWNSLKDYQHFETDL